MKAVFRCDATADIGFGHASRCIALAEALRLAGVDSTFAGLFDPAAREQLAALGFALLELAGPANTPAADRPFADVMTNAPADLIVVDSYRADERYLSSLRSLSGATVVLDDFGTLSTYPCDAVLNFTFQAPSLGYAPGPLLLLGPSYFPARRRLVELRPQSIERPRSGPVRKLLIAIAGADPKRIAARLARLLRPKHAGICLRVVAASEADFPDTLVGFAPGSLVLPRQPDLSDPLLWADACIAGGGLIKYESAFMGVPAAAVSQNEGQAGETLALTRAGLVFDLGLADDRSDEELASAMDRFLDDDDLRSELAARVRDIFPPDPAGRAALAIIDATGR